MTPREQAQELVIAYRVTQMVRAACELRLSDRLAAGPRTASELAAEAGVLEDPLRRLLRALVSVGVFVEQEDGGFATNELGECFADRPGSARPWALMLPRESYASFAELPYTLETGLPAFDKVHGTGRFEHMAGNPEAAALFNEAMRAGSEAAAGQIVAAYDFSGFTSLVDVGGGTGTLLAEILRATPGLRGALLDIPSGLEGAPENLRARGVLDRVEIIEGDFFSSIPSGFDAYVLKYILHDWDDDRATHILLSCAKAMNPSSLLLVVERLAAPRATATDADRNVRLSDLNMMVALGGRERSQDEFERLLGGAGLQLQRVVPLSPVLSLLEARL